MDEWTLPGIVTLRTLINEHGKVTWWVFENEHITLRYRNNECSVVYTHEKRSGSCWTIVFLV